MSLSDLSNSLQIMNMYDTHCQLQRHVYSRTLSALAKGDCVRDSLSSPAQIHDYVAQMRQALIKNLGGLPQGADLNIQYLGSVKNGEITIEKIIYQSRPNVFVTALLYLPPNLQKPNPAVLFLCGHSKEATVWPEYQHVCMSMATAGLIVLAMDPIGQGERVSYDESLVAWGTQEHDHVGAQGIMMGKWLARYFLHDAMRGIDVLCSRPEVDPSRIGVTGNSGGGTQTSLMMMADPRIAAAAPATYINDRKDWMLAGCGADTEQIFPGMTALGWDHEDILLSVFPKPVCVLAVLQDFFPIEATVRTFERAKRHWQAFANPDDLELFTDDFDHHYSPNLAAKATEFFTKHLLGSAINAQPFEVLPTQCLQRTKTGLVRTDDLGAQFVFDELMQEYALMQGKLAMKSSTLRRAELLEFLKNAIHFDRKPIPFYPRVPIGQTLDEQTGISMRSVHINTQSGVMQAQLAFLRKGQGFDTPMPTLLCVWDEGTKALSKHADLINSQLDKGLQICVLDVAGVGAMTPNAINPNDLHGDYGTLFRFTTDLAFLGDSLCALRSFDVCRAVEYLRQCPLVTGALRVYADGWIGVCARLAAPICRPDGLIISSTSPKGYSDWVLQRHYDRQGKYEMVLPGLLAYGDVKDVDDMTSGFLSVEYV